MARASRFVAVLALAAGALALPGPAPASVYTPWTIYDRTHGLAGNKVQAIAPDGAGGLLIGTDGGMNRFDGVRWQTWTVADGLPDDQVHSLAVDGAGRVWVGAGAGFGRLEGGRWSRLGLPPSAGAGRVTVASGRDGRVWLGHGGGLMRFDAGAGVLEAVPEAGGAAVLALLADREGRLWAGTAGGLLLFEAEKWKKLGAREGLPAGPVAALLEDAAGGLWCATSAGLASFDGVSWRPVQEWDRRRGAVAALALDGEGRIWAGTRAGAGCFDGYDWRWYDGRSGLPADEVLSLAADPNGSIWVGTVRGLAKFDTSWAPPPAALRDGPGPRAPILAARDGTVWSGAERGLLAMRGRDVEEIGPHERLDGRVRVLHEDPEGELWIGADNGLYRYGRRGVDLEYHPNVRKELQVNEWGATVNVDVVDCDRRNGMTGPDVTAIAADGEGGIWVGTSAGLSGLRDGAWTCLEDFPAAGRAKVTALANDPKAGLWVGTPSGLWLRRAEDRAWQEFGRGAGLASDAVSALLVDRAGVLWVGTDRGVSRREGEGWVRVGARQGLVSDRVLSLFEDSRGRVWFGTAEGVSVLDRGLFGSFGEQDGLPSPRVTSIAEAGGRLWFGAEEGVSVHRTDRSPPDTRIKNPPAGPVGTPFALLEYAGSDFETRPGDLRYSWRLDGGPWSAYVTDPLVTVTDLANGRHAFEVRAVDRELNVDPTPAACAFEVNTGLFDLELVEASFAPLYASLYQFYATDPQYESRPAARLAIRNKFDRPLRVKASVYIPGLMDFPTDAVASVPPGATQTVPLRIELNDGALDLERTEVRQARVTLQYTLGGERKEAESTHPVTVVEKHGMRWDEPERIGLYVTHLDEAVQRFARETALAFREEERAAIVYDNLLRAIELFDALAAHGLRFIADPENPFGGLVPGRPELDLVRLPRETLRMKSGDCDDLAVLYAALLENIGIDTALVDVGDHVFVMFDTGLHGRQAGQLARDAALLHVDARDRVWVPVETTLVGRSFSDAWRSGAETMAARRFAVVEIKEAWKKYAPLRPPAPAPDIVPPPAAAVRPLFADDVRRQEEALTSPEMKRLAARVAADPGDADAVNRLGVLLARRGYLGQAAARFERVLELRPGFAGGPGNLANVLYEQGRFKEAVARYQEALALAERPEVHVELALTYCELGRFDLAREHYRRAMDLAPGLDAGQAAAGP